MITTTTDRMIYSGNIVTEPKITKKQEKITSKLAKVGIGFAVLFSTSISASPVDFINRSNKPILAVTNSKGGTYNKGTKVYTSSINEKTEAIRTMNKERQTTVDVELHIGGYVKNTLDFSDLEENLEETFEIAYSNNVKNIEVQIINNGYKKNHLDFKDEV
jgi:hypothetical protein